MVDMMDRGSAESLMAGMVAQRQAERLRHQKKMQVKNKRSGNPAVRNAATAAQKGSK